MRQRLDPLQHAIISAHVTFCRDSGVCGWQALSEPLVTRGGFSITLQFGELQVLPDGCSLLHPARGAGQYQRLRQSILGAAARVHGAHVTLLHPRNATGITCYLAQIAPVPAGLAATFRSMALVEQRGSGPWLVRREYGTAV